MEAKYKLASLALVRNDSVQLFNILNSIPINYNLSAEQDAVYSSYNMYYNIYSKISRVGFVLDSISKNELLEIAQKKNSLPSVYALNTLLNESYLEYEEPVYFPVYTKSAKIERNFIKPLESDIIKLYPNPADEILIVETKGQDRIIGDIRLQVTDLIGKEILSKKINFPGQTLIYLSNFNSGLYFVNLTENGILLQSNKLIIVK